MEKWSDIFKVLEELPLWYEMNFTVDEPEYWTCKIEVRTNANDKAGTFFVATGISGKDAARTAVQQVIANYRG